MFETYEPLMTVKEACDALHVGKNTIYELIRTGKIDSFRTGRTWKIKRDELSNYILNEVGIIGTNT